MSGKGRAKNSSKEIGSMSIVNCYVLFSWSSDGPSRQGYVVDEDECRIKISMFSWIDGRRTSEVIVNKVDLCPQEYVFYPEKSEFERACSLFIEKGIANEKEK